MTVINFGTKKQFKRELLTEISAVLAFSAIKNNDKVGVIFFSNIVEYFIPPKKGKSHILRIISEVLSFKAKEKETSWHAVRQHRNGKTIRRTKILKGAKR